MINQAITIENNDNLGIALTHLKQGESMEINGTVVTLIQNIPAKHKFALIDLEKGDDIYMYGLIIGTALKPIAKGGAVTIHNTAHKSSDYHLTKQLNKSWTPPDISTFKNRTFLGYHRSDGQVGTDNIWLVFPLVFCENRNIEVLKKTFEKALGYDKVNPYEEFVYSLIYEYQNKEFNSKPTSSPTTKKELFENVHVRFITHHGGCGGTRQDAEVLCQLLAGYVNNPNVAGATVLSLGCQNAEVKLFKEALSKVNPHLQKPVLIFDQQSYGKESDLMQAAINQTFQGLIAANSLKRAPAPLSKLTIGLECGGSDGFSGISANPAVGHVSDLITALGGKAILSEFPELCGIEQELINRMPDRQMAHKFVQLMKAYEQSAIQAGSGFDMNPSPGNIKDGLITDAMKSAGAAKKGGTSPVQDVLDYAEYASTKGLSLLCTPGNDVESTTGLVGSGANMVLFTTGLGTPTGNPAAPVLKISSNTPLAQKMSDIIDIDAGPVIEGKATIEQMGEQILEHLIKVASGELTSKAVQMRQYDFIPWKRGVSL